MSRVERIGELLREALELAQAEEAEAHRALPKGQKAKDEAFVTGGYDRWTLAHRITVGICAPLALAENGLPKPCPECGRK